MPFGYVLKPIQERDLKVTIEMALYISKVDEERGRAEKRFKTIFEEAPLGVALIDSLTGFIYEVNQKFADIAGRTRQEMTTIDWISITHPDDVQEDLENMALLNAGEISGFNMNKRYVQPDGTFVWINMTIAPVFVEDKTQPRHLSMIEDITERKKMEESLKKAKNGFLQP
jgi:PAS domain S-box-containing protein